MKKYFYRTYIKVKRSLFGKEKEIPFKIGRLFNLKHNSVFPDTYLSYTPDKYSFNLNKYKQSFYPFYDKGDIDKWTRDNYINNAGDLTRFYFLNLVIDQLIFENITGDIAELGVYKGNSAFLLSKFAKLANKKLYLFDTYKGFKNDDLKGVDKTVDGQMFSDTSLNYVQNVVGTENTVFVEGYFPESLKQIEGLETRFCLVHIDCDLEQPFVHGLNYFYPRLTKGAFLILHDYSSLYWDGARNAINNFFADKPEMIVPVPDKSGTAVVRKL